MINNLIHSLANNPIFVRLARRGVSLRATLWIAVGSLLFSMLFGTLTGLASDALDDISITLIIVVIGLPSLLLHALYPPLVAAFTATVVGSGVQSEDYTILKLTLVTPQQIVRGYVFASLYRQRLLHAIAIGLSFIGLFQGLGAHFSNNLSVQPVVQPFEIVNSAATMISSLLIGLRIMGLAILASAMGVMLSLLWRRRGPAGIVAATVMIILQVAGALGSALGYWLIFFPSWDVRMITMLTTIFSLGYGVFVIVVIYVLAWGMMRLAQRWV